MRTEDIMVLLENYNSNRARFAYLEVAIADLADQIGKARSMMITNEVMRASGLDGMPKGNAVTSQVENLAVRLADGWTPEYVTEMEEELKGMQIEKESVRRKVAYVDAWLLALSEKQGWVIRQHIIAGKSWAEMIFLWGKEYGTASKTTMKRLRDSAMAVIENTCRKSPKPEMSRI